MKSFRLKKICDAVQRLSLFHADEREGVFARHLVMATLSELFRHETAELKWANGLFVPITTNVHEGASEVGYQELEHTGEAAIVADGADDLPQAEIAGRFNIGPVKTVACMFQYSTHEVRAAMMQNSFDIATEKAASARTAYSRKLDELLRVGFAPAGLYGLTNVPGLLVVPAITGTWSTATAAQIVADFSAAANLLITASNGVERPNTALFPIAQFTRISTLKNSDSSDITVLQFLKQAFPWITTWDWDAGMSTVGTGSTPAALIYEKNPMKARAILPMDLRPLPPEARRLRFEVSLESRYGGVIAPRPRSIVRLENI